MLEMENRMPVTSGATTAQQPAEAVIVRRDDHAPSLATFWVRPRGVPFAFRPGQYVTLGLTVDGAPLERHYSVASAPHEVAEGYELYVRRVDGGALTPRLWRLGPGDGVSLRGPKGKFVLRPADEGTLLFVCTCTGIAPFLSMLKAMAAEARPRRVVVVHGVSYPADLTHAPLFARWRERGLPVTYVPTVSRPAAPESAGWGGRRGRAEAVLDAIVEAEGLKPEGTVALLCGNPGMVDAASTVLAGLGFPRERVRRELYWARGAGVSPAGGAARAVEASLPPEGAVRAQEVSP
jgi:ferredoxin--NADP+ reductase